ncbi:MAG: hypothetical protein JW795_22825, partial [Chitinivibrionales bacterium]|nr:hypothetical protein [Chitinivibrionales bacterium]
KKIQRKNMSKKYSVVVFGILFLLLESGSVWPSAPVTVSSSALKKNQAIPLMNYFILRSYYGTFNNPGDCYYFLCEGAAGDTLSITIAIPFDSKNLQFLLKSQLTGPGLINSLDTGIGTVEFVTQNQAAKEWYQPAYQITYLQYPTQRLRLPKTGTYHLTVATTGYKGPFLLSIGDNERNDVIDILKFPLYWWNARTHAQLPVWHGVVLVIGALLLGIAVFRWIKQWIHQL